MLAFDDVKPASPDLLHADSRGGADLEWRCHDGAGVDRSHTDKLGCRPAQGAILRRGGPLLFWVGHDPRSRNHSPGINGRLNPRGLKEPIRTGLTIPGAFSRFGGLFQTLQDTGVFFFLDGLSDPGAHTDLWPGPVLDDAYGRDRQGAEPQGGPEPRVVLHLRASQVIRHERSVIQVGDEMRVSPQPVRGFRGSRAEDPHAPLAIPRGGRCDPQPTEEGVEQTILWRRHCQRLHRSRLWSRGFRLPYHTAPLGLGLGGASGAEGDGTVRGGGGGLTTSKAELIW